MSTYRINTASGRSFYALVLLCIPGDMLLIDLYHLRGELVVYKPTQNIVFQRMEVP